VRLVLLILGLIVGLAMAEAVLRLSGSPVVGLEHQPQIYRADSDLGFRYVGGAVGRIQRNFEIDNEVRISSTGFHDVEHDLGAAGGRILVLGDSMTAGLQVPASRTWTRMLESELRGIGPDPRVQVINLGVDGTGPRYQLALLREACASVAPDVVVVASYANDALDLVRPTPHREIYRGYVLIAAEQSDVPRLRELVDRHLAHGFLRRLWRLSYVFRAGTYAIDGRYSLFRTNVVLSSVLHDRNDQIERVDAAEPVRRIFEALVELSRAKGFRLVVVPIPARDDAERTDRVMAEVRHIKGVTWRDPLPVLREQLERDGHDHRDMYWRHDGHFNAYGHRMLGKAVAHVAVDLLAPGHEPPVRRLVAVSQPERFLVPTDGFRPRTRFTVARHAPRVAFAIYPVPLSEKHGPHWGHWGTGTIHPNGRIYGIVGNHLGRDGEAFLYELDPSAMELRRVADLQDAVGGRGEGDFGFGKVHGRVEVGRDGRLYFSSWGGKWRHDPEHPGSRLFAFDPASGVVSDRGILVPRWGTPSTRVHSPSMRYYAEYFSADRDEADFLVYDLEAGRIVFRGDHDGMARGRDFFVDVDGHAYFNNGAGSLEVYDPQDNSLRTFPARMPGDMIRRVTYPDPAGRMYGVTIDEHVLFSLDPHEQTIDVITELWSQTAALALDPAGRYLYYIAGSNQSDTDGTQIVQVDLAAGATQKVIAFVDAPLLEDFGYRVGRTNASGISPVDSYNITISGDGGRLYVALNGTMATSGLERAAMLVADVPEAERPRN